VHIVSVRKLDAVMHSTPLVIVCALCIIALHLLMPQVCACLTLVASIVSCSNLDALLLMTPLVIVCIAVLHLLVPPCVHVDVACTHCQ
jgi:hypothetical protein